MSLSSSDMNAEELWCAKIFLCGISCFINNMLCVPWNRIIDLELWMEMPFWLQGWTIFLGYIQGDSSLENMNRYGKRVLQWALVFSAKMTTVQHEIFVCRKISRFSRIHKNFHLQKYFALNGIALRKMKNFFPVTNLRRSQIAIFSCHEIFLFYSMTLDSVVFQISLVDIGPKMA